MGKGWGYWAGKVIQDIAGVCCRLLQRVCRFRGVNKEKGEMNAASWFTRPGQYQGWSSSCNSQKRIQVVLVITQCLLLCVNWVMKTIKVFKSYVIYRANF